LKWVLEKYHNRWLVFSKRQTALMPENSEYDHPIDIKEGGKILNLLIYNLSS
jgi:hypothetical protein